LDSALASGLAVAGARPVSIPSRTLGHELDSSPVGRLSWLPLQQTRAVQDRMSANGQ